MMNEIALRAPAQEESDSSSAFSMEQAWNSRVWKALTNEFSEVKLVVLLRKFLSVRVILMLVGCSLVLASGLAVFGICLTAGRSSVAVTETSLQKAIAISIIREVLHFLASSYSGVNVLGEQLRVAALSKVVTIRDFEAASIRRFILPVVRQFVPSLYIGFPSGYFVGYNNIDSVNGSFVLTETLQAASLNRSRFIIDAIGAPVASIANSVSMFNASERPWFQDCAKAAAPVFSSVYSFVNIKSLGITATLPIFEDLEPPPFFSLGRPTDVKASGVVPENRIIAAVIGADLSLLFLNDFLSSLEIGLTGEAFVLDNSGYFLGTSQARRVSANGPDFTLTYTHSTAVSDPVINATLEVLLFYNLTVPIRRDNYSDYERLKNGTGWTIIAQGRSFQGSIISLAPLSWFIVIVIPYDDYIYPAEGRLFVSLYVAMGIVALATLGFFVFSLLMTRPMTKVARSMDAISKELVFDDENAPQGSNLMEIDSMLESFSRLKFGLLSFSRYVPLPVVRILMQYNASAVLGVESRVATVFFSDIEGFTSISEIVEPHVLVTLLDEYFTMVSEIVLKTNGLVIDYFGDGVLAAWNAPLIMPGHQLKAVKSALLQQQALVKLRESWAERGLPQLHVRIGITVGRIWAGSVGSKFRMKYTLLGDSANLASRLESLNKHYGTYIMISGALHDCVSHHFVCKVIDFVSVAGRGEPTMVYEVLLSRTGDDPAMEKMLKLEAESLEAFNAYQSRDWQRAKIIYSRMGGQHGEVFLERIKEFEVNPPDAQWQGVTAHRIK